MLLASACRILILLRWIGSILPHCCMRMGYMARPHTAAVLLVFLLVIPHDSHSQPARRKRLLAWGDTITAYQHDSISHALATIERLGRESGAFDTYIRTDSQWISKLPIPDPLAYHNLNDFDAIFFMGTGDNLKEQQKKDLMLSSRKRARGLWVRIRVTMRSLIGPNSAR